MANSDAKKIIKDFSSYYGVKPNKLNFLFDKIPTLQISGKNEIQGLRNLVSQVSKSNNPELDVIQDQWVEYVLTYLGNLESSIAVPVLKDLNDYMVDKVYFVGNQLRPVDVLFYYLLYDIMLNLTFQEKEKYLNFSRWFNNIQFNKNTRLGRTVIPFSKNRLYI